MKMTEEITLKTTKQTSSPIAIVRGLGIYDCLTKHEITQDEANENQ